MPIINRTMKDAADWRVGGDWAYTIKFGPIIAKTVGILAILAGVVLGVRWLLGHLSAPSVSITIPNASGVPLGLAAAAVVGCVAIALLVRRIVRHVRYGV